MSPARFAPNRSGAAFPVEKYRSPSAGSTYVTMDNVTTCSVATAPPTGWSTLPGGTAQDLPDEYGN